MKEREIESGEGVIVFIYRQNGKVYTDVCVDGTCVLQDVNNDNFEYGLATEELLVELEKEGKDISFVDTTD